MRYTTIIDISEEGMIYKNVNCRLVYLHLVLKSGYHDDDRDQIAISIRTLAARVGISVGATRHALEQLQKAQLLARHGDKWQVKKWTIVTPPTPRKQPKDPAASKAAGDRYEEEIRKNQERIVKAVRSMTREELVSWLEELESGKSLRHHGAQLNANQKNIEWLKLVIQKI